MGQDLKITPKIAPPRAVGYLPLITLLALTALLYAPSLWYGFVYDDIPLIAENVQIRDLSNLPALIWQEDMLDGSHTGYYRPLVPVLDALVYAGFGASPWAYHAYALTLHLLCVGLLYVLLARLIDNRRAAFFGAMFFALSPVGLESVAFVSARNNVLSGAFVLGSALMFLGYRERGGWWRLGGSLALYSLGLASKEFAALLPAVLLVLDYGYGDRERRPAAWPYALYAAALGVYMLLRALVLGGVLGQAGAGLSSGIVDRLSGMPVVLVSYLRLMVLPINQRALYDVRLTGDIWSVIWGLVMLALLALIWNKRQRLWVGLPALWIMLFLAPVSNLVPVSGSAMAERYLYLPMMGLALFVAGAYSEAPEGRMKRAGSALLLCLMAALLVHRMPVWKSDESLYAHMSETTPSSYKGHYNLGNLRYKQGRYEEAAGLWARTLEAKPDMYAVHNNLAVLYERQGKLKEAEAHLSAVLSVREMPEVRLNLASVLVKLKRFGEAEESFDRVVALEPGKAANYIRMAEAYESVGRMPEALAQLQTAMLKAPRDYRAYNIAGTMLGTRGDYEGAYRMFDRALGLSPSCAECAYNRAQAERALLRKGD